MAGHSQFKNIMHRKGAQDAKRAKIFTKVLREITVSAKAGPDPEHNPRLRNAMQAARTLNIPKDRVQNAMLKVTNPAENDHFDEMRYEGYGPGNVALIVEALTDNRNRTASEVRSAFTKFGGNLGETGSVGFMFKRIGLIVYTKDKGNFDQFFEATVEANGNDCVEEEDHFEIVTEPELLHAVQVELEKRFGHPEEAHITWKPSILQAVDVETGEKLLKLIDVLEDCDDVQKVIGNFILPEELIAKHKHD